MPDKSEILLETSRFTVEQIELPTRSGGVRPRAIVRHPGAVVVLPLLDDGRVVLIRNYRASVRQTLIELPAGTLEVGENPADCAARELSEETGYRAERLAPLCQFYASPGIMDEQMHVFVATGLAAGAAQLEENEQIENLPTPWEEALAMACDGRIADAKTIAALLVYDRRRGLR